MPQPEAIEKQAGWGKNGGIGKMPQPEAIEKQADWVKKSKQEEKLQQEVGKKREGSVYRE